MRFRAQGQIYTWCINFLRAKHKSLINRELWNTKQENSIVRVIKYFTNRQFLSYTEWFEYYIGLCCQIIHLVYDCSRRENHKPLFSNGLLNGKQENYIVMIIHPFCEGRDRGPLLRKRGFSAGTPN